MKKKVDVCVTHNELRGDDAIHNGAEEGRDDADTDEDDGGHELNERQNIFFKLTSDPVRSYHSL